MSKSTNMKVAKNFDVARELHKSGELTRAVVAYKKVLRTHATQPDALHYLGLAYYQMGQVDLAINHIKRAIVLTSNYPDAMSNLANIYKETGRLEEAQTLYTQLLLIAPDHTNTLVNIALILRETDQTKSALTYIQRALEIEPKHAIAHHNLGNIYSDFQQFELAQKAYSRALQLNPKNYNSAKSLAHVLNILGKTDEAFVILKALITQHPDDVTAQHLLAAYDTENTPTRASDMYIKQTFDAFSASFNTSLSKLQYKIPELINDKLLAIVNEADSTADILDIGCGTGLCGSLLIPLANNLIGVDLSPKMLQKAEQLKVYNELHERELCTYMQTCDTHFDYIVCADTFVYFGELETAFAAAFNALRPNGYFIFSVEQHHNSSNRDYHLQLNGRYSHSPAYLSMALTAVGFMICSIEDVIPRMENGKAVDGALVLARKP